MLNGLGLDTDRTRGIQAQLGTVLNDRAEAPNNTVFYGLKCYLSFATQKQIVISKASLTVV